MKTLILVLAAIFPLSALACESGVYVHLGGGVAEFEGAPGNTWKADEGVAALFRLNYQWSIGCSGRGCSPNYKWPTFVGECGWTHTSYYTISVDQAPSMNYLGCGITARLPW